MELQVLREFSPFGATHARLHPFIPDNHSVEMNADMYDHESSKKFSYSLFPVEQFGTSSSVDVSGSGISDEDELYVQGSTVIWSRNGILMKSITINPDQILKVFFAQFDMGMGGLNRRTSAPDTINWSAFQRGLCILSDVLLHIHFEDGRSYSIPYPAEISSAFPLQIGIIFQRATHAVDISGEDPSSDSNVNASNYPIDDSDIPTISIDTSDPMYAEDPIFFSLQSPHDEFRPVSISYSGGIPESATNAPPSHIFRNVHQDIIFTQTTRSKFPIMATFDRRTGLIHVWRVFHNELEEKDIFEPPKLVDNQSLHPDVDTKTARKRRPSSPVTIGASAHQRRSTPSNSPDITQRNSRRQSLDSEESKGRNSWEVAVNPTSEISVDRLREYNSGTHGVDVQTYLGQVVVLKEIWVEPVSLSDRNPPSSIFVAQDACGADVLCIMKDSAQCLFGYRMSYGSGGSDVTQCFRYPAKAAVPIISSRNDQYDVLFIRPDFSFSLWIGEEPLIPCILPQNIQSLFESEMNDSRGKRRRESWSEKEIRVNKEDAHQEGVPPKMIYYSPSRTSRPVALSDSALDRLNIVMSSGVVYRCSAYFNPPGVLTQSCINILDFVMPQKEMCLLRTRLLQLVHTETHKAAISNGDAWEAFMITLYSFLHRSPEITKSKTSAVSDWDYMLSSSTHHRLDGEALTAGLNSPTGNQNVLGTPKHLFEASKEIQILYPAVPDLIQYLPSIIQALHLVYEDFKLNVLTQKFLLPLARLLVQLSKFIQAASHVNYYVKEHSIDILQHAVDIVLSRNVEPLSSPRNIFEFLHDKLHQQYSEPFPTPGSILPRSKLTRPLLSKVCDNTRKICLLYDILSDPSRPAIDVVRCLAQEGFKQSDFDVLPFGLEIPIREILWVFKHNPPLELTPETYALIGREDLSENCSDRQFSGRYIPSVRMDNSDIEPLDIPNLIEEVRDEVYENDRDGTEIDNDEITLLRFNRDCRLEEVQQLLQSSASTSFQFPDRPDLNGDELAAEQQLYAPYVADRTLALSVGRGCLTYGTSIKSTTEAFPIPEIDTDVKAVPSTLVVHFEKPADRENYLTWSKFNNGTAAGLSIPPGYSSMEEAWIQYNMKGTDVPEYAGFLLGIGLNGYLKELSAVGRYETFHEKNDFVNIGAQLGIAASWCGTGNSEIYKITAVHAPFLRPHKTNEMALTPSLQCAGIFSLGLLFLGQSHRRITLRTMTEIGRRQFEDKSTAYHRSFSLLAGFTVGMVNVGVGNSAVITNGKVVERLLLLMNRGKPPSDIAEIRSEEMCSTHLLPMEYGLMNPHTTAPSAIVALGLIFLKTNDKSIAARLEVPRNEVLLDNEPTDVLLLKVTCKNLIMWDYIRSSIDWVDSQIPNFMREHWQKYRRKGVTIGSTDFCLDDGILSAYANVVGGACFALALRFAGSNSRKIYEVLAHFMDDFTQAAAQPALTPVERVIRTNVRSSLDVIASAIGIVMAGSGDLESLRRLRRLHNRIGSEFSYGTHMAVHMAIGMLFLGGGTCTLGTSNKAIAALLAAFYPRYPSYPDDNRFHFQPLRHMWALAVERRCLVVRDAETRQALSVPLIITVGNNFAGEDSETKINMTAPCLLPEFKYIKEVQMNHDRYLPIKVDFSISNKKWNVTTEGYSLFLKKKIGYLSYLEDSVGSHNIMSEYIPKTLTLANLETLTKVIKRNEIINSFCTDPELLSFASLMCRPTQQSPKSIALADFCTSILYECIKYDKPEAIQCYLSLYYALEPFKSSPKQAQLDISTLWNLKLVLAYNERLRPRLATSNAYFSEKESFIRSSLVHDIRHLLSKYFAENYLQPLSNTTPRNLEEALQHYCRTLQFPNNMSRKLSNLFAGYIIYSDIPNLVNLCDIGRELNTVQQKHNERELEVMALLLLGNVNMEGVHKVLEAVGMN